MERNPLAEGRAATVSKPSQGRLSVWRRSHEPCQRGIYRARLGESPRGGHTCGRPRIERIFVDATQILNDSFERVRQSVHHALEGLNPEQLRWHPYAGGNTIAWLAWHLTRVQDHHVADAFDLSQLWLDDGWCGRFDLPFDDTATGYGQDADEVAEVQVESTQLLLDYHDAVVERTLRLVAELDAHDLDRVVDEGWDPPVTLGARLVSVIADDLQHAGQAAYLRGQLLDS